MNKKQMYKLAHKIADLEILVSNPEVDQERKSQAEKEIMRYAGMLAMMPDGLAIMGEIDNIIQKKLEKKII